MDDIYAGHRFHLISFLQLIKSYMAGTIEKTTWARVGMCKHARIVRKALDFNVGNFNVMEDEEMIVL